MKRYFPFIIFIFVQKSLLRLPPFLLFKFGRHARDDDDGTGTGHHQHHFGSLKLKSRERDKKMLLFNCKWLSLFCIVYYFTWTRKRKEAVLFNPSASLKK
jgi:hypothetical protein